MSLQPKTEIREVSRITQAEKEAIINFLQGAVYCWCKNKPNQWFSLRDLMGGENFYWQGTPLYVLFEKHKQSSRDDKEAIKLAGRDAGWLLKKVLNDDQRKFINKKEDLINKYKWLK